MHGVAEAVWRGCATALSPVLHVLLRVRAARGKESPARLGERFGRTQAPRPDGKLVWLHAASVGETISAMPLLMALPQHVGVVFTTGTVTSAAILDARLREAGLADRVTHQFVPLDVPTWGARFLDHWRPDAACFLESELWPNLLGECHRRGIPTALVNGRLSARSAARWAQAGGFARHILGSFAWVAAQSEPDAERLRALGASPVDAPGNLKFATPPLAASPESTAELTRALAERPRWLAASTHAQDDAIVAEAHRALSARHAGLLTAIVPRHPARGAALAAAFGAARRSQAAPPPPDGVWIADTMGELGLLYRCFPLVLMGKSFAGGQLGGGQNPWEAAQLGCAVLCGPNMGNFTEAVARLRQAGGLLVVRDTQDLVATLDSLLSDPARVKAMGEAARQETLAGSDVPAVLAARVTAMLGATE